MLILGIAGGTGSGKTTVVHQIINELPEAEVGVISQDSYYRANHGMSYEERSNINFDQQIVRQIIHQIRQKNGVNDAFAVGMRNIFGKIFERFGVHRPNF